MAPMVCRAAQNVAAVPDAVAARSAPVGSAVPGPIAELQRQLREEGYNPGVVNGVMTEQTRHALSAYLGRNGHPPANGLIEPVKRAQASLQRLGLFAGPVDGNVGPQTRDAILRFQAAHHLAIDPRVTDTLLAALPDTSTTGSAGPVAPATTAPSASSDELGRRPLPSWVNPPPIR